MRRSQAVVEVNEGVPGPKRIAEFLARNEFSPLLEQCNQKEVGLSLKLDLDASLSELAGANRSRKRRNAPNERMMGIPALWYSAFRHNLIGGAIHYISPARRQVIYPIKYFQIRRLASDEYLKEGRLPVH